MVTHYQSSLYFPVPQERLHTLLARSLLRECLLPPTTISEKTADRTVCAPLLFSF
jgi:hypothetical protein